ncbi:MAG: hypothetical protein LC775_13810, partial [Acidobacteria bacterium]|nr:hypothetical protein [Acidobacteriota bacterium]
AHENDTANSLSIPVESHDIVDKFLIEACPTTSWTFLPHLVFAFARGAAKSSFNRLFGALSPRTRVSHKPINLGVAPIPLGCRPIP